MLDVEKVVKEIKKIKAKKVLLQFPDGLKTKAVSIVDEIESRTDCICVIWAGSCYGACDVPDVKGFDLFVQFGHNSFGFEKIWKDL